MKTKIQVAIAAVPLALCCLGFDCFGGETECWPPDGVLLGELYCDEAGVRGYCYESSNHGDTGWQAIPCFEGNTCEKQDDLAVCRTPDGGTSLDNPCVEGETKCDGDAAMECSPVDGGDGLLEWMSKSFCALGCSAGDCIINCDAAEEGLVTCTSDGRLAVCDRSTGSLAQTSTACAADENCMSAEDACEWTCGDDVECQAACGPDAQCVSTPDSGR